MVEKRNKNVRSLIKRFTPVGASDKLEQFYQEINRRTRGWLSVLVRALNRFGQNRGNESAASITYYTIFSIIPLLIFVISIAGSIFTTTFVLENIGRYLADAFPVSLAGLVDVIDSILVSRGSSNWIATVGLLWAASNMFNSILTSINLALAGQSSRGYVKNRLLALVLVPAMAVLVVVLFILIFFFRLLAGLLPILENQLLNFVLPSLILASLIFMIYKIGPAKAVNTKPALICAALVTIAIDLTTRVYTWYLNSELSTYKTIYGSMGALIGLLFWVFLSYWILLYGAYLLEAFDTRWSSVAPESFFEPL